MNIELLIETIGGGTFRPWRTASAWTHVPRINECIVDMNGDKYRIEDVIWCDSLYVKLIVRLMP